MEDVRLAKASSHSTLKLYIAWSSQPPLVWVGCAKCVTYGLRPNWSNWPAQVVPDKSYSGNWPPGSNGVDSVKQ